MLLDAAGHRQWASEYVDFIVFAGPGPSGVGSRPDHSASSPEGNPSNRADRANEEAGQQIIEPRAVKERAMVFLPKVRQNRES